MLASLACILFAACDPVLSLNPKSAQTHKDLGVIYLNKRLFDYAKYEFEKAYELEPENKDIVFEYANYMHATGDFTRAEEMYKYALSMAPDDPNFLTFAAKNKMAFNDNDAAYSMLLKALSSCLYSLENLYLIGVIDFNIVIMLSLTSIFILILFMLHYYFYF